MAIDPGTPRSRRRGLRTLVLGFSLLLNVILILFVVLTNRSDSSDLPNLHEIHERGERSESQKIAIIRVGGVIAEGLSNNVHEQIEYAARDTQVKAVVMRIDSPGGTVSESDAIHRNLLHLRENNHPRYRGTGPKPITASMGSIAASGGYYVAMPAERVFAEPTTITGSIGVFAALPNVAELATRQGVKVELIKAGDIKGSGSFFHAMTPEERQPWQDLVNHAYERFLTVVAEGRPGLTVERLRSEAFDRSGFRYDDKGLPIKGPDGKPIMITTRRYRADGGTFVPPDALKLGLIDEIGTLDQAITWAAERAGLRGYRVVRYERPKSLAEDLFGIPSLKAPDARVQEFLATITSPRLCFMAPGYEFSGLALPAP